MTKQELAALRSDALRRCGGCASIDRLACDLIATLDYIDRSEAALKRWTVVLKERERRLATIVEIGLLQGDPAVSLDKRKRRQP